MGADAVQMRSEYQVYRDAEFKPQRWIGPVEVKNIPGALCCLVCFSCGLHAREAVLPVAHCWQQKVCRSCRGRAYLSCSAAEIAGGQHAMTVCAFQWCHLCALVRVRKRRGRESERGETGRERKVKMRRRGGQREGGGWGEREGKGGKERGREGKGEEGTGRDRGLHACVRTSVDAGQGAVDQAAHTAASIHNRSVMQHH